MFTQKKSFCVKLFYKQLISNPNNFPITFNSVGNITTTINAIPNQTHFLNALFNSPASPLFSALME